MSRDTRDLHPKVRDLAQQLLIRASDNGTPILITQTLRTNKEQDQLYAQGRSLPGKKVTNAKGGESYHNYGLAFDFALIVAGQVIWNKNDNNHNGLDDWEDVGKLGEALGLSWGGRWKTMPDKPHFELTFGLSIKDLLNGKRPPQ